MLSPASIKAAKCITPSKPPSRNNFSMAGRSSIESSSKRAPFGTSERCPWQRLSTITTLCPESISSCATVPPTYPAPPVTRIFNFSSSRGGPGAIQYRGPRCKRKSTSRSLVFSRCLKQERGRAARRLCTQAETASGGNPSPARERIVTEVMRGQQFHGWTGIGSDTLGTTFNEYRRPRRLFLTRGVRCYKRT
jgi:hypothetical protein